MSRFIAGELVKTTHTSPEWLKNVFGHKLRSEMKQQEKSTRGLYEARTVRIYLSGVHRAVPFSLAAVKGQAR